MSVLGNVFGSLQQMTLWQLLFGFLACMCYAALQGGLIRGFLKALTTALGLLSALGFVLTGDQWVYGFMLLAFAIAGLGIFSAAVWLLASMLDLDSRSAAPLVLDSTLADVEGAEGRATATSPLAAHPLTASTWTLPSH